MSETPINTQLLIAGQWQDAADGRTLPILDPASGELIGKVAMPLLPIWIKRWPVPLWVMTHGAT